MNNVKMPSYDVKQELEDMSVSLQALQYLPRWMLRETQEVMEKTKKFNREVIRPRSQELDQKMHEDPDYLPWDFIKEANRRGFYTLFIPKLFGGKGYNLPSLSYVLEEMASECASMANLVGVHWLGVATLTSSWNIRLMNKIMRDVAAGERKGEPRIISLAITESEAGTDVEEVELLKKARVGCHIKKVKGGRVLNGRKIFISNGHLSTWHMVIGYEDVNRPEKTMAMVAVRTGTDGFSFGGKEKKMGQKGCPASELIFEDCFIPEENVCFDGEQIDKFSRWLGQPQRSVEEYNSQVINYVLSTSRAGVAGFATGVARGAYLEALRFATEEEIGGKMLIDYEWVRCQLAEMYKNVALARLSYVETNYANSLYGMFRLLQWKPMFYFLKLAPQQFLDWVVSPVLNQEVVTKFFRNLYLEGQKDDEIQRTSGWASLSKFSASDLGMRNCQLALDIMGRAGVQFDQRAEKFLRDSKLLQIYEGTNQLNRLNLFDCLIGRDLPGVATFDE